MLNYSVIALRKVLQRWLLLRRDYAEREWLVPVSGTDHHPVGVMACTVFQLYVPDRG